MGLIGAPEPLREGHNLAGFDCGVASLNDWLSRNALRNQLAGASRTFIAPTGSGLAGYYALAASAVATAGATGRFRRNMPEPIPVVVLGRLAVDLRHRGTGLGRALFRDVVLRTLQASDSIGIRGLVVHALSDDAKAFYLKLGLTESPLDPMMPMVALGDLRAAAEAG